MLSRRSHRFNGCEFGNLLDMSTRLRPLKVTWYVDNVEACTYPTFASTWQPVQLILSVWPGGVNGSPCNVLPPNATFDWVGVWDRGISHSHGVGTQGGHPFGSVATLGA